MIHYIRWSSDDASWGKRVENVSRHTWPAFVFSEFSTIQGKTMASAPKQWKSDVDVKSYNSFRTKPPLTKFEGEKYRARINIQAHMLATEELNAIHNGLSESCGLQLTAVCLDHCAIRLYWCFEVNGVYIVIFRNYGPSFSELEFHFQIAQAEYRGQSPSDKMHQNSWPQTFNPYILSKIT